MTECGLLLEAGIEEATGAELDPMGRTVGRDEGCGREENVTRVREDEEAIPLAEEDVIWFDEVGGMIALGSGVLDGRDEMTEEEDIAAGLDDGLMVLR